MSVLIKGMKMPMPERCWDCRFMDLQTGKCYADGSVRGLTKGYKRPAGCPLIELPDNEKAPTVDAVSVVRCKDCKYNYGKEHGGEFNPEDIVCDYWATDGLNADDFCSYGERSEE